MIEQKYEDVLFDIEDALIHDAYTGFKEDYLVIHSLLRKYSPKSICEIGTNIGSGVCVIHRALPNAKIYSLDLDFETMKLNSLQYPVGTEGEDRVGSYAIAMGVPYTQLRGDSMTFNYSEYPCEAYFIDGEHDYAHPYTETCAILKLLPKLVIYHDANMSDVMTAIIDGFRHDLSLKNYDLYRVLGTRIAYCLRK